MIRFIKEDNTYFYVVTERGQTYNMCKNRAKLVGYTEKTWTIRRDNYAITYDERGNFVDQHMV